MGFILSSFSRIVYPVRLFICYTSVMRRLYNGISIVKIFNCKQYKDLYLVSFEVFSRIWGRYL